MRGPRSCAADAVGGRGAAGTKKQQGILAKQQRKEDVELSKALRQEREEREAEEAEQLENEKEHAASCARNKERDNRAEVDDDETYCFCNEVYSGKMYRCDECFNWFHETCMEEERIEIGGEHGCKELYDAQLKKYWVRSANIIIKPGKVHIRRGREGGSTRGRQWRRARWWTAPHGWLG